MKEQPDFRDAADAGEAMKEQPDFRDAGASDAFMRYLQGQLGAPIADAPAAPAETCVHPVALVKLTDGIATCEGCGRVFELRDFGLPIP